MHRSLVTLVIAATAVGVAACSGSDGEPENNRIGPIDGPATVTDDGGAELDGAPVGSEVAITDGS